MNVRINYYRGMHFSDGSSPFLGQAVFSLLRIIGEDEHVIRESDDAAFPHIASEESVYHVIIETTEVAKTKCVEEAVLLLGMAYYVYNQKTPRTQKSFAWLLSNKVFQIESDTKPAAAAFKCLEEMGVV